MQERDFHPARAARIFGSGAIAIAVFFVALVIVVPGDALAQAKKGAAAPAQPGAGVRQQGQNVPLGPNAQPGVPGAGEPDELTDPRQHMRNFVSSISAYARSANPGFIVLTMGGLELLERVDPVDPTKRAAAATYIRNIDGVIAREINFHPPDERNEIKTDERIRADRLRLADIGQKRDLRIWSIDYAKDMAMAQESIRFALSKSYLPFPSLDANYRFNALPRFASRPLNENPNAVTGINHVKNFLMLTDSSRWDTQEEFVLALADTNYDAIVIDVFHRGRFPMTARTVEGLKYKKLGTRRLVLAYANIGEAESHRYYWKPGWKEGSPKFIGAPAADNPDKYAVEYWNPAWRELMTGNNSSYIYGIVAQGFDGIVLDGVEAYRAFESTQ